ncbi:MAG: hypothetical protein AABY32_06840 [Nanoarchaeota archaeon]
MKQNIAVKRPAIITVICIIGFIGLLFVVSMIFVFSDAVKSIGAWYLPYLAFSAVVGLVCFIGLWMMKKWSIIAYTIFVVINQVVMISMNVWNILALIIPGIIIVIGFLNYKEMK